VSNADHQIMHTLENPYVGYALEALVLLPAALLTRLVRGRGEVRF
jgi:hypothetical protein